MRLTADDLLRAARLNQLAGILARRTLAILVGTGLVGAAVAFMIAADDPYRVAMAAAGGIVTILYLLGLMMIVRYGVLSFAVRRQVREQKSLSGGHDLSWDDERLIVAAEGISSQTTWAGYHRWREDERLLLLYLSSRLYQVLPKRAFSPAQVDDIRGLLSAAGVRHAPLRFG